MKKAKAIASFALAASMMATSSFAGAAVLDNEKVESYGENVSNGDIGSYQYKDPSITVSDNIGSSYESKYDLREEGLVTPVKDQAAHNFCWAFASLASMESNLVKKKIINNTVPLSEAHLGYFHFHGGNNYSVSRYAGKDSFADKNSEFSNYFAGASTLARGYGAVRDSVVPYSSIAKKEKYGADFKKKYDNDKMRVKQQFMMDDMASIQTSQTTKKLDKAGMNNVKYLIKKNGALATVVYSPSPYMEEKEFKAAYGTDDFKSIENFYSGKSDYDHGVTVVGWDDNYPKDSFKAAKKPVGDGAWLIKNSYGTDFGKDKGYYWVSYYEPSMCVFASFTASKKDGRQTYQYDGTGFGDDMKFVPTKNSSVILPGANVFKARKDVMLDQVVVPTSTADSTVRIKIYACRNGREPSKGTKLYGKKFTVKNAPVLKNVGSHKLNLGKKIGIPKGMYYAVTVSINNKLDKQTFVTIPFEIKTKNDSGIIYGKLSKGMSYMYDGKSWKDTSKTGYENPGGGAKFRLCNALVKARGKDAGSKSQKIKVKKSRTVKKGKKISLKAKRVKGKGKLVYQTSNSKKAAVTGKGVVKAKKRGTVKITVRTLPTTKYKSAKKVVKIKIK